MVARSSRAFGILRMNVDCGVQISLGSRIVAGMVGGHSRTGQGTGVAGIDAKNCLILGDRAGVILGLLEQLCRLEVGCGIGRQ